MRKLKKKKGRRTKFARQREKECERKERERECRCPGVKAGRIFYADVIVVRKTLYSRDARGANRIAGLWKPAQHT